jgi:hypothetical protein
MSDYPSMSYCAFENTGLHIDQVAEMLDEAIRNQERLTLGSHEQRAFNRIYDQCQSMVKLLERYEEMVEELESDDTDPDEELSEEQ